MDNQGCVYILTNKSFNFIKVGYAKDLNKKLKSLNNKDNVPFEYEVYATYCSSIVSNSKKLKDIIDNFYNDIRVGDSEFYSISPYNIYRILYFVAKINGELDNLKLFNDGEEVSSKTNNEWDKQLLYLIEKVEENYNNIPDKSKKKDIKLLQKMSKVKEYSYIVKDSKNSLDDSDYESAFTSSMSSMDFIKIDRDLVNYVAVHDNAASVYNHINNNSVYDITDEFTEYILDNMFKVSKHLYINLKNIDSFSFSSVYFKNKINIKLSPFKINRIKHAFTEYLDSLYQNKWIFITKDEVYNIFSDREEQSKIKIFYKQKQFVVVKLLDKIYRFELPIDEFINIIDFDNFSETINDHYVNMRFVKDVHPRSVIMQDDEKYIISPLNYEIIKNDYKKYIVRLSEK